MANLLETSILEAWTLIDQRIAGSITTGQLTNAINRLYGRTAPIQVMVLVNSGQTAVQRTNVLTTEQEIALKIAVAYYLQQNNISNTQTLKDAQSLATNHSIDLNALTQTVMNDVIPVMIKKHQGYKKYILPGAILLGGLIIIFMLTRGKKNQAQLPEKVG
ncbi:MAG: hypothetical protein PHU54_02325 [Candidatus Omnitrophica bacterium]|nr:hypothetical protein [Candidatus Omnitrophota bacterium]